MKRLITLTAPIHPTGDFLNQLILSDSTFDKVKAKDVKAPEEVWKWLLSDLSKPNHLREVNGCGSNSTKAVPDTNWGLVITPICHIHDATHKFSKTPMDCQMSNNLLLTNMANYINTNSNSFMQWPRHYRAMTYYNSVHAGRKVFCPGYLDDKAQEK